MHQTTVEEILAAAQQLPSKERRRLSELLQRETASDAQFASKPAPSPTVGEESSNGQNLATHEVEMKWLLEHPEFWEQHRGEHVALRGNEMIAVGKTRREVIAEARRRGINFPFVQYLPKRENEWLTGFSNQPVVGP